MKKKSVAIVGCGAIGAFVAERLHENFRESFSLDWFSSNTMAKAEALAARFGGQAAPYEEAIPRCDVVLEATTVQAMPGVLRTAVRHGKALVVLSIGGFLQDPDLLADAEAAVAPIYLPSGALAGFDGIMGMREIGLEEVVLTITKHPKSLAGNAYLEQQGVDLTALTEPATLFDGPADQAIRNFPANVNVAINLSLAGLGFSRTRVHLVADPNTTKTVLTVSAKAGPCAMTATTTGVPLPQNPRSSLLAAQAALGAFRRLASPLHTGT